MEKDVTRHIEEQLSAFLDGELPEEELALLVRRLELDEGYRATLDRYALMGGAMRNDGDAGISMRRGIMSALEEPPVTAPSDGVQATATAAQATVRPGFNRYLVAATALVGVMAVFLAGNFGSQTADSDGPAQLAAADPSPLQGMQPLQGSATPRPTLVSDTEAGAAADLDARMERHQRELRRIRLNQERMRSYLISHGDYSSPLQGAIADSRMYVQQASFSE
ncbi:MAG: hypothetical protein HKN56_07325 [Gammaproteobacteria bacterium]|nr:hypothetical protein [Gammaproteobacteria bacterium]NND54766.1 hypothetical protein [Gammaproteobacteria bacterium]